MVERDRDRDDAASFNTDTPTISSANPSVDSGLTAQQQNIDLLFEPDHDQALWEPPASPQVLGELLDSRHMLPLLFPSDPRNLSVLPQKLFLLDGDRRGSPTPSRSESRASTQSSRLSGRLRSRNRKLREVGISTLKWVDGVAAASRWSRTVNAEPDPAADEDDTDEDENQNEVIDGDQTLTIETHVTPLTYKRSARKSRMGQQASGDDYELTPVDPHSVQHDT